MGAVLRVFAYLGRALGLLAWLGGTALVAFALTTGMGPSPDETTALAKIVVVIAGVVIALIASVVLLRVSGNLIWFFVCFAFGAFAALAGAGFSPGALSGEASIYAVGALAIVGVSVVALAITRRMAPFLICLGLLGLAGAGAAAVLGLQSRLQQDFETISAGVPLPGAPNAGEAPATEAAPEPRPAAPPAAAGEDGGSPTDAAPTPAQNEAAAAAAAAAAAEREAAARAAEAAASEQRAAAEEAAAAERQAQEQAQAQAAPTRPRTGATRGLGMPGAAAPPPPAMAAPEPPAAAPPPPPPPLPPAAVVAPPPQAAPPPAITPEVKPEDFQTAELKFNKPQEMEIDRPYIVSATIAGALAQTQATLGNVGPTVSRSVNITRKVRVELVASDFDIKKLHTIDTVLVTQATSGQWSWEVTPRRTGGERKILLQVYGVIERDGVSQGETLINVYEEIIPVKVTPMAQVRLVSQGIVDRWQPIAGALGVIGGIWVFLQKLFGALARRRKQEAA